MSTEPIETELLVLKQRALAGDIAGMRNSYQSGDLQWLRNAMTPERYAHLGIALESGDVESVRSDLASVDLPSKTVVTPVIDPNSTQRSLFLQSQRNGLIAGAIVVALALLGLIGYLALRNNDEASDTTLASIIVVTPQDTTVPDTLTPDTTTPDTSAPITTPAVASSVVAVPTTTPVAPTATTAGAPTTVKSSSASATTPAPPVTASGTRKSDVLSAAERSATFGPFLAMIDAAGLRQEIQAQNPSTVLAPTESAFASLPSDVQAGLRSPANSAILARIVRYNVIPQAITLRQFTTSDLKTLEGSTLSVVVGNNKVSINDATVTGADVLTISGVLHAVDKLLVPPGVSLNALVAKPVPAATLPPQTAPPATQAPATPAPPTPSPSTSPPAATQAPQATSSTLASTTTKVP